MEELLAFLVLLAPELVKQASKDVVSNLIKQLFQKNDSAALEQLYSRLLIGMRDVIGVALEEMEIKRIQGKVNSLKMNLNGILGRIPADIRNEIALVSTSAKDLLGQTMEFGDKAMPAFFITTGIVFVINSEYQRVQPNSKFDHQLDCLRIYFAARKHFKPNQFVQRKIDHDLKKAELRMDEEVRITGSTDTPGHSDKRVINTYTRYYRHWFVWKGETYDCGWQTDRVISHGDGINKIHEVIKKDNESFKQQVMQISTAWDKYYQQLIETMKNELSPEQWKETEELIASFNTELKSLPVARKLEAKEVAELKLPTEPGKSSTLEDSKSTMLAHPTRTVPTNSTSSRDEKLKVPTSSTKRRLSTLVSHDHKSDNLNTPHVFTRRYTQAFFVKQVDCNTLGRGLNTNVIYTRNRFLGAIRKAPAARLNQATVSTVRNVANFMKRFIR